jgi:hypothetical protein
MADSIKLNRRSDCALLFYHFDNQPQEVALRRILIVCVLLLVSLSPTLAQESSQSVLESHVVPGTVADVPESPVQLAEPSYGFERSTDAPDKLQITGGAVTVTNISGRDIQQVYLIFTFKHRASYGSLENRSTVDQLHAGETRVAQSKITIRGFVSQNWTLTVTPTGARFADGVYWAAPRENRRPLLMERLSQPSSYLRVRSVRWTDNAYQAALQVDNAKVTAYRLGIVKDTADSFEVRIGRWVKLNDEQTNNHALFTDESNSLNAEQVFARQAYTRPGAQGKEIVDWGGVAIFIAELRFADGRTWRQDTTREALFWNN